LNTNVLFYPNSNWFRTEKSLFRIQILPYYHPTKFRIADFESVNELKPTLLLWTVVHTFLCQTLASTLVALVFLQVGTGGAEDAQLSGDSIPIGCEASYLEARLDSSLDSGMASLTRDPPPHAALPALNQVKN
jgi:hypothetical protein